MLVRLEQFLKAPSPISVTDGGMEMLVRLEQPRKALFPIFVTDGGMEMLVRLEQPEKADSPIFVSPSDITKEVNCRLGSFCAINTGPSARVRL